MPPTVTNVRPPITRLTSTDLPPPRAQDHADPDGDDEQRPQLPDVDVQLRHEPVDQEYAAYHDQDDAQPYPAAAATFVSHAPVLGTGPGRACHGHRSTAGSCRGLGVHRRRRRCWRIRRHGALGYGDSGRGSAGRRALGRGLRVRLGLPVLVQRSTPLFRDNDPQHDVREHADPGEHRQQHEHEPHECRVQREVLADAAAYAREHPVVAASIQSPLLHVHSSSSGGAEERLTRSRAMRRRRTVATRTSKSPARTLSPATGMCPNSDSTHPASVSYSSDSSIGRPRTSCASSTDRRPSTTHEPSPKLVTNECSWSNSSVTSPMTSSTMSSMVTTPAVPPYSSTTTTMWFFARRISPSRSIMGFVSGTNAGGRMWSLRLSWPR